MREGRGCGLGRSISSPGMLAICNKYLRIGPLGIRIVGRMEMGLIVRKAKGRNPRRAFEKVDFHVPVRQSCSSRPAV